MGQLNYYSKSDILARQFAREYTRANRATGKDNNAANTETFDFKGIKPLKGNNMDVTKRMWQSSYIL